MTFTGTLCTFIISYDGFLLKQSMHQELKESNVCKVIVWSIIVQGQKSFVTVRNCSGKFVFLTEGAMTRILI